MLRRIALHYKEDTPVASILQHPNSDGVAICDYTNLNNPVKGLPRFAEYNQVYSWYSLCDQQKVYRCRSEFSTAEFIETASAALSESRCRTARLEYYQIFDDTGKLLTEADHLGMADLSGNTSRVKFQGSSEDILSAYDDILSVVQEVPLTLLSVICTYQDSPVAEIQIEFTRNVDAAAVFEKIVKQYPGLRMMGCWIPEWRGDPWYVYVSGSHSVKINTIPITYERTSANSFYEELKRSKYWGEPEWLQGDIMIDVHKPHSGLARINPFNWSNIIEIPQTVCGRRITMIRIEANLRITKLTVSGTVKKIGEYDLTKCTHLKDVMLPGVTEIRENAFAGCKNLKNLWLSDKLRRIAVNAFPKGIKPTIHAPAGSYAETWAKTMKYTFEASE